MTVFVIGNIILCKSGANILASQNQAQDRSDVKAVVAAFNQAVITNLRMKFLKH